MGAASWPLPDWKRIEVKDLIRSGESDRAIAAVVGVNRKTVAEIRRKMTQPPVAAPQAPAVPDRRLASLSAEVGRLKKALKDAHAQADADEAIRGIIGDLANAPSEPPDWIKQDRSFPSKGGSKHVEVPVVCFADWHVGEVVSKSETNGANEYNMEIADRRIQRLVDTTIDLCRHHHSKDYPGIVVNLVGDFVSGALHPELAKTDELEVLPAVLWVLDRLEAAILRLADEFGRVFVPAVPGNHGRNTLKPEFKRYAYKNFDWLIYRLLARRFANDSRVQFLIPDSGMAFYRVFGKRFLLVHGDMLGVRGGDGIIGAIGPIMRGEIKKRGQQTTLGREYDYLVMGHWHQALWLPRAIVANALKGFDEYAQNSLGAVPTLPSQPLFFVHPKWGITSRWEVYVEGPQTNAAAPWVSVFEGKAA